MDPHGLQLATRTPDEAGDAGEDLPLVVPDEDPELPVVADARGRDGGSHDVVLEQGQIGRVRRVLDNEAVRSVHQLGSRVRV